MELALGEDVDNLIISDMDWKATKKEQEESTLILDVAPREERKKAVPVLLQKLQSAFPNEREEIVKDHLLSLVCEILGISAKDTFKDNQGFFKSGMDSIMAVQFRNQLQNDLGKIIAVPATIVFDCPNISKMTNFFEKNVFPFLTEEEVKVSETIREVEEEMSLDEIASEIEKEFENL